MMVVGVSDIGVGSGVVNGWLRIAVSGAWEGVAPTPLFVECLFGVVLGVCWLFGGFFGFVWVLFWY